MKVTCFSFLRSASGEDRSRGDLWHRGALRLLVALLAIGLAPMAGAQTEAADDSGAEAEGPVEVEEKERVGWAPEFEFAFGIHSQAMNGDTVAPNTTEPLKGNGDSIISEFFSFGVNLYTPLQLDMPEIGKPRLMMGVTAQVPLADGLIAARLNRSWNQISPEFAANCPPTIPPGVPTNTCRVTMRNRASIQTLWTVGVGVDFTIDLPILDEDIHFIPMIEYVGMSAQAEGTFKRRSSAPLVDDAVDNIDVYGDANTYHGIGSSYKLAVDVYEEGPWAFTMFLTGRVAWMLDDNELSAKGSSAQGDFIFNVNTNEFLVQGMGGVTVRYDGF